jgi:hypothetical protein
MNPESRMTPQKPSQPSRRPRIWIHPGKGYLKICDDAVGGRNIGIIDPDGWINAKSGTNSPSTKRMPLLSRARREPPGSTAAPATAAGPIAGASKAPRTGCANARAHASKIELRGGKVLRVRGKSEALFPEGTERVAGGGAQRHPRNAVPKTAHPAEGWQRICSQGGLWHALPGCGPWGAAFRRCRFAQPSVTFRDASGIGSSPAAGSSRFFRCVSHGRQRFDVLDLAGGASLPSDPAFNPAPKTPSQPHQ